MAVPPTPTRAFSKQPVANLSGCNVFFPSLVSTTTLELAALRTVEVDKTEYLLDERLAHAYEAVLFLLILTVLMYMCLNRAYSYIYKVALVSAK
jgi:hypothetical protein